MGEVLVPSFREDAPPAPVIDLTEGLVGAPCDDPAARWAACGGQWLTGRPDGPTLGVPRGVLDVLDGAAARLRQRTAACGTPVDVDGAALLGERAALAGLVRAGTMSCGGSTRVLPSADGWVALSLARADDDIELLPAWLGVEPLGDPWPGVTAAFRRARSADLAAGGGELGLAVGALGERVDDPRAVVAGRLAEAPPAVAVRGLRVLDLSSLWAGPLCAGLLAAAGMDVVKLESTRRPDGARVGPPPFYDLLHVGTRSVAVDLTSAHGRAVLAGLVAAADVVIEASRPRALEQLGVRAAAVVRDGGPRVWLSITGHGRDGPHAERIGFGDDAAVAGGLVARDGAGPVFCADGVADPATGLLAATAVVDRLLSGGRWLIDVALARVAARLACGPVVRPLGTPAPPRARAIAGHAPAMGAHTAEVLAEWGWRG